MTRARFAAIAIALVAAPLAGAILAAASPAWARTTFFSTLDDVPVPPGFAERSDLATAFEGAEGRILVAAAAGPGPAATARAWTVTALKGLGWSLVSADDGQAVLLRGRETVTLETDVAPDGLVTLRVRLVARPAPAADR